MQTKFTPSLKVLFYGLNFDPEPVGIGKYTAEWACWLTSRGHQVRVITAPPYFPQWRVQPSHRNAYAIENHDGLIVQRCPLWVPRRPSGLTRLLHLASFALFSLAPLLAQCSRRPDVVIIVAPAFFCAPGALFLRRLVGRQCISWLHIQDFELDAAFELGLLKGRWLRTLAEGWERRTLQGFSVVSSISQVMVQRLHSKGVPASRTQLLPNWVDLKAIQPQHGATRSANSYREELGIKPDQIVLLYSGSMNKKQGLEMLVEVINRLSAQPSLVWLLAGEGPTKADLIHATAGQPQVRHLSLQPAERMNDWLNAADIHLLPQKAGAADLVLPSKLLGILASGRPVVASSPEGSELALLAGHAGRCVPPGDAPAFADALQELIESAELRAQCGRLARQLAEEHFGKDAVLKCFEQQLLKQHRSGTRAVGR
jgi:colanic acid biosynthesis glycosyl transferase WcaI